MIVAYGCVLFASLLAQGPVGQDVPEQVFYRAFFHDRGERDAPRALRLYRRFLAESPKHALAGEAARFTLNLLQQMRRGKEATAFAKQHAALLTESAKPGINSRFLDPNMRVADLKATFEGESREIFKHRRRLVELVGLKPGDVIADVGAGTGLFSWPFARTVGKQGRVYAVELAPRFVSHLKRLAKNGNLDQVTVVECGERSTELKAASVDVVFLCDTYHHFEFWKDTMASIVRALRPGGRLVLIDFERIPGKSRKWILGHVRAGKAAVRAEIESTGLHFVRQIATPLKENYMMEFRR
ncbi:MAG: SAM-dependent methyltransferase [Planctomycetes bacterium]|nr:SAM-dependent methyltransferase [Planctomycetota bacterium]